MPSSSVCRRHILVEISRVFCLCNFLRWFLDRGSVEGVDNASAVRTVFVSSVGVKTLTEDFEDEVPTDFSSRSHFLLSAAVCETREGGTLHLGGSESLMGEGTMSTLAACLLNLLSITAKCSCRVAEHSPRHQEVQ